MSYKERVILQSVVGAFKFLKVNERLMVCLQNELFPSEEEVEICDAEQDIEFFSEW